MPRPGVTREQVFEAADALVREGQSPTVVAVRGRLGGGSPNTITPLLGEWKALHESRQVESIPPVPEGVETVMRQVWGSAWKEAQGQLEAERAALTKVREDIETERGQMLGEISRLDSELEAARETLRLREEALETERRAHEHSRGQRREAQAIAAERAERIAAQEEELQDARRLIEEVRGSSSRLETQLGHAREELEAIRGELQQERERVRQLSGELEDVRREAEEAGGRAEREAEKAHRQHLAMEEERTAHAAAEKALAELRIEAAALVERAGHVDELWALLRAFRERHAGTEDARGAAGNENGSA